MSTTKTITLITGANGGLGYALAQLLLEDSTNHVLLGARSSEKGTKAVADLKSLNLPGTVEFLEINVDSFDSIKAAADKVTSTHGHIDNLVNNAAIASFPDDMPMYKQLEATLRTNVLGPQIVTELFVPLLEKSSKPRIVHITSGAGSIKTRFDASNAFYKSSLIQYRTSKAALNMLGACHHVEYSDKFSAKVFLYCPGFCVSNLSALNKKEMGAKSSEDGMKPVVEILKGEKDELAGKFMHLEGTELQEIPW